MEDPDGTAPAPRHARLPSPEEPRLPMQDGYRWHPERLAAEIDELNESHLIRGYD